MPNILLLGAGLVAEPCLEYCLRRPENHVTVATRTISKAEAMAKGNSRVSCKTIDVTSDESIDSLVKDCDIVISLVPYIHHADIIKSAIKFKKHFVSTSYVSPAMMALDEQAKAAGIVVMNEIGLDPGIDHLYAMRTIDEVHAKGGEVKSFISYCGGLPAPECSNNPLGYKFSWSPRGVLLAVRNDAKFLEHGKIVEIPGPDLLRKGAKRVYTYPGFATVGYPNRDSSFYGDRYGMPECETALRGTLRYEGNVEMVQAFADVGLLGLEPVAALQNGQAPVKWRALTAQLLNCGAGEGEVEAAIVKKAGLSGELANRILAGFKWFGVLSDTEVAAPRGTYLDALCAAMEARMMFAENERDLVILQHEFGIVWKDGTKERRTSTLIEYGAPGGYSAMSRLVGVPCGVATQLILDGKIAATGVLAPLSKDLYEPLLDILEKEENVVCVDEIH